MEKPLIDITLTLKKETPGTFVYEEKTVQGEPPKVKSQYIQKWVLGDKPPKSIRLTVVPA